MDPEETDRLLTNTKRQHTMGTQSNLSLFWDFLKTRKKWWLTPIVITLLLLAGLIVLVESSTVAPFIYALF